VTRDCDGSAGERSQFDGSQDALLAALDISDVGMFVLGPEFTVEWSNEAIEEYFGLSRSEVVGMDKRELVRDHLRDVVERSDRFVEKVLGMYEDNTYTEEFECHVLPGPDREERWLLHQSHPIEQGEPAGGRIEQYTDITEQRRELELSVHELKRQNDLFAMAQDVADVGAWEYDIRTDENRWTDKVYDIYDLPTCFDPSPEKGIEYYHPVDREKIREAFEDAVETGDPYEVELRLVTDSGNERWVRTTGIPETEDGEVVRGAIQDITDQKEYERELERQNDRLEEFAEVVSHDLQNPLQVAASNLDLVREEYQSDRLDAIERALDRMSDLIDDLLALARQGQTVFEPEPVDLETSLRHCWHNIDTGDATLDVDVTADVLADPSRLQHLFTNLLANAVEHGGETVSVRVASLPDGFAVEDDGDGIPEDERDWVFEYGHTTAEDGNGLGLAIVTRIVEAHGWEITVTESDAGGARFEIPGVEFV